MQEGRTSHSTVFNIRREETNGGKTMAKRFKMPFYRNKTKYLVLHGSSTRRFIYAFQRQFS